jgi:hypothetical protein
MTDFTPGPWTVVWNHGYQIQARQGPVTVSPATANGIADARLIATAPDMLAALKLAAVIIGHPDDSASKLIASVIAQAEGK